MDILTIGEVLIDLTQTGKDARGIPQFAANPGGAPANLAVAAARLGAQTAFIGKVGADAFGRYLKEVLVENKVDVSGMAVDADHPTTMAVVSVDATGERDFSFYRSANADVMLSKEDISEGALKAAKIVHFGSVSLTADPSRTATLDAAARAKKLGAVITYDPNYRANLWKNKEDAIAQMKASGIKAGMKATTDRANQIGTLLDILPGQVRELRRAVDEADTRAIQTGMDNLRSTIDMLESLTDADLWPVPTYAELLFL